MFAITIKYNYFHYMSWLRRKISTRNEKKIISRGLTYATVIKNKNTHYQTIWNGMNWHCRYKYVRIFNLWCIFNTRQFFSNLQVALRIRPMNEDEILMGATQIAHKVQKKVLVKKIKCKKLKSKEKSKVWRYIYVVKKIKAKFTYT